MRSHLWLISLLLIGLAAFPGNAVEPGQEEEEIIAVTASAKATAPADLAVVFLRVQSQAPLAADALQQTLKKVADVRARLAELGYKDGRVRFSGNRFAPAGAGVFYPGGQRPTGFQVYNNLYVFLEGDVLEDLEKFNAQVSALLDELSKLGASPVNLPISRYSMGGMSVVAFTVKDASPYVSKAVAKAIEKARPVAESIAKKMGVEITGIESVRLSPGGPTVVAGPANPLEDLPYEYYSSSKDEVPVRVRVEVRFRYR